MLGENTIMVLYGIMGLAIILLVIRLFLRRKNAKKQAGSTPLQVKQETPREIPENVREIHSEQKIQEPVSVSSVATAHAGNSWEDRKLFSDIVDSDFDANNPIPRIEPHEVPSVDQSDYYFGKLTPLLSSMLPESESRKEELKQNLKQAGYYQPHAWQNLCAIRYFAIIASMLFFGAMLLVVPKQLEMFVIGILVVFSILGWALPSLMIKQQAKERSSAIERAMPDMLDMLNMCVSQGLTVPQSLRRISLDLKKVYPELAEELAIVSEQAEIGNMSQALNNFSKRMDLPDVRSLTSLLNQTERMGTSVSHALVEYSDSMREHLRQRADEKANQASFKLLFPIVLCMLPAVFMVLLGPAVVEMSDFFNQGGTEILSNGRQAIEELNR